MSKAYKKFAPDNRNLLVIADDLFVSLEHGTEMHAGMALYSKHHSGCFIDSRFQNLGGVGIFWVKINDYEVWYEMKLFLNPNALPSTALPDTFARAFHAVSHA